MGQTPRFFHSTASPLPVVKPNQGKSNLQMDWFRAITDEIYIDGNKLSEYATEFNNFNRTEDVRNFFDKVILVKLKIREEQKNLILNYLERSFHQGGLLYPTSNALSEAMQEYSEEFKKKEAYAAISEEEKKVNIITTKEGFKIQEYARVKELISPDKAMKADPFIRPDKGKEYVIDAQITLDVNFSQNSEDPQITVESNTISFGNKFIEKKLDTRSFLQIIYDLILRWSKLNKVEDISGEPETNNHNHGTGI